MGNYTLAYKISGIVFVLRIQLSLYMIGSPERGLVACLTDILALIVVLVEGSSAYG
ncbi:MAG: hypothetical protein OQJ78_01980 [Ignavibacteriaceae bacterium]|nr:hypothetical protein [Ignavibacteriaceae bacterium]